LENGMKKSLTALALAAALIPVAVLAGGQFGEKRLDYRVERMTEQLQLDTAQQAEVRKILQEQQAQRRALREQTRERIDATLTDEQRAKLAEWREQRAKRFCDKRRNDAHRHGPHHPYGEHVGRHAG
jgi:Spy/CpxP family protein refolding chaperone